MIERGQDGEQDWTHEMQVMRLYFSAHGMGWVLGFVFRVDRTFWLGRYLLVFSCLLFCKN